MLITPVFRLLSTTWFLLLGARSVLADSAFVPVTVHPQKPAGAPYSKGTLKGGLGFGYSPPSPYIPPSPYQSNCGPSIGNFPPKGPTTTGGRGHRRRYEFDSLFEVRADETGNVTTDNLDVDTSDSVWYAVEITVGGQNFTVQLDTGSSDLWLHTGNRTVHFTNTTDLVTSEVYGQSHVEGKIKFADLQIGGLTIERQALLHVTDADVHGFDLRSYDGILGMAFDVGPIHSKVHDAWGAQAADHLALSPMTALFAQEPDLPNNFDVQLSRPAAELDDTADGLLAISQHVVGYENVVNAPRLPRVAPQHWSVAMDAMLINGHSFSFNQSVIEGVPAGKIAAALDTGSSLPTLPPAAIDAIYSSVPGALYDTISEVWLLPCDSSPNVTFVFGGQQFPVHPLDLTFPVTATLSINEKWNNEVTACINTFQPLTTEPTISDGFDIVLADGFLHNVYISFDYGDWNPANNTDGTPFVQMVSTTDSATMWADFHANRTATLAQLPLPLDPPSIVHYEGGSTSTTSASPTSTSSAGATQTPATLAANLSGAVSADGMSSACSDSWGSKYGNVVLGLLAANLAVGAALLVVVLTMCVRRRKGRTVNGPGSRYTPVAFKEPVED